MIACFLVIMKDIYNILIKLHERLVDEIRGIESDIRELSCSICDKSKNLEFDDMYDDAYKLLSKTADWENALRMKTKLTSLVSKADSRYFVNRQSIYSEMAEAKQYIMGLLSDKEIEKALENDDVEELDRIAKNIVFAISKLRASKRSEEILNELL